MKPMLTDSLTKNFSEERDSSKKEPLKNLTFLNNWWSKSSKMVNSRDGLLSSKVSRSSNSNALLNASTTVSLLKREKTLIKLLLNASFLNVNATNPLSLRTNWFLCRKSTPAAWFPSLTSPYRKSTKESCRRQRDLSSKTPSAMSNAD